jgi:tripartite-type tricarboxylate transporter receptor subunit TctC
MKRRTFLMYGATAAASMAVPAFAQKASDYPAKAIKIVVGFPPGGATDLAARLVANKLQAAWGQPVVIENKPGGGSNIGTEQVVRAPADGYTLLLGTIANATNMSIYKNLSYNTLRDLAPISLIQRAPSILVVTPSLPARNLNELIALAKSRPGQLSFASSGAGGSPHLAGELLKMRAGIDIIHVPYKGAAPALQDTIAGVVSMGFKTALSCIPHIQSGRLRAIAVASRQRLPQVPNVPTMAEAGMPDFEVSSWNGLMAPAATPADIVNKLSAEVARIMAMPDVRETFSAQATEAVSSTPEEFRKYVASEIDRWGKVVQASGARID